EGVAPPAAERLAGLALAAEPLGVTLLVPATVVAVPAAEPASVGVPPVAFPGCVNAATPGGLVSWWRGIATTATRRPTTKPMRMWVAAREGRRSAEVIAAESSCSTVLVLLVIGGSTTG